MRICQPHGEKLRQAIKSRGLYDLVSKDGHEAVARLQGEMAGPSTVENFDPLMACNNMIVGNALKVGGLYLLGTDADGNEYCPLCEAEKHGFTDWIECAAEGVTEHAKVLAKEREAKP